MRPRGPGGTSQCLPLPARTREPVSHDALCAGPLFVAAVVILLMVDGAAPAADPEIYVLIDVEPIFRGPWRSVDTLRAYCFNLYVLGVVDRIVMYVELRMAVAAWRFQLTADIDIGRFCLFPWAPGNLALPRGACDVELQVLRVGGG